MVRQQQQQPYDLADLALNDRQQMASRPIVVDVVKRMAFEALARQAVPEDATAYEEAEGLIAHAMAILRKSLGKGAATSAHSLVEKHARDASDGSFQPSHELPGEQN